MGSTVPCQGQTPNRTRRPSLAGDATASRQYQRREEELEEGGMGVTGARSTAMASTTSTIAVAMPPAPRLECGGGEMPPIGVIATTVAVAVARECVANRVSVASWVGPPGQAAADPGLSARASQAGNLSRRRRPRPARGGARTRRCHTPIEFRRPSSYSGHVPRVGIGSDDHTSGFACPLARVKSSSTFGCFTNDVHGLVSIAEVGDDAARLVNRGIRDGNVDSSVWNDIPLAEDG